MPLISSIARVVVRDNFVRLSHNPDLQRPLGLGPITATLPTLDRECRLLYRGLGQALSGYVMPYSFCLSFCTGCVKTPSDPVF